MLILVIIKQQAENSLLNCASNGFTTLKNNDLFIQRRGWWKFKKPRDQRKYSHKNEWKEDRLAYLSEKSLASEPYLNLSKKNWLHN